MKAQWTDDMRLAALREGWRLATLWTSLAILRIDASAFRERLLEAKAAYEAATVTEKPEADQPSM